MKTQSRCRARRVLLAAACGGLVVIAGCPGWRPFGSPRPAAPPLGTLSDPVWENQETNAEKSDFVVHENEFVADSETMNTAGEDHLKRIAFRLTSGQDAQVLVERSMNSAAPRDRVQVPRPSESGS